LLNQSADLGSGVAATPAVTLPEVRRPETTRDRRRPDFAMTYVFGAAALPARHA
jgi:hypothetical protein